MRSAEGGEQSIFESDDAYIYVYIQVFFTGRLARVIDLWGGYD